MKTERLAFHVGRIITSDALRFADDWSVELVTMGDDVDRYIVYHKTAIRYIEAAGQRHSEKRAAAASKIAAFLVAAGVTPNTLVTTHSGAHGWLSDTKIKEFPMNGTAAWCFSGSPFTQALKTIHIRPVEHDHVAVFEGGRVKTIKEARGGRPRLWVRRGSLCFALSARGKRPLGYVQVRGIRMETLGNLALPTLRAAGYAHARHFQQWWAGEYRYFPKALAVWVFEIAPLSPAVVTAAPQIAPDDDWRDLPIFSFAWGA